MRRTKERILQHFQFLHLFFLETKKAERTILPLSIVVVGAFGSFFLSVGSELGRTKQRTSSAIDRMGPLVEGQFGLVQ